VLWAISSQCKQLPCTAELQPLWAAIFSNLKLGVSFNLHSTFISLLISIRLVAPLQLVAQVFKPRVVPTRIADQNLILLHQSAPQLSPLCIDFACFFNGFILPLRTGAKKTRSGRASKSNVKTHWKRPASPGARTNSMLSTIGSVSISWKRLGMNR
jgi:hypothetical protein